MARLELFSDFDHITPSLRALHWLPLQDRVFFKLCVLMYCIDRKTCPRYLGDGSFFGTGPLSSAIIYARPLRYSAHQIKVWRPGFLCRWSKSLEQPTKLYPRVGNRRAL